MSLLHPAILPASDPAVTNSLAKACQPVHASGQWRWSQRWRNVVFAHWQLPAADLRPHLPAGLEIDTWHGSAWISLVAFNLDVHHRWMPSFGLTENFVEMNLRTYVRCQGEPGIYFLSIHAGGRVPVALARLLTPLPYVYAPLTYRHVGTCWELQCRSPKRGDDKSLVAGAFTPVGECAALPVDSLEGWLLERYRAFAPDRRGRVVRMIAQHEPWSVQRVEAKLDVNNLGKPWGFDLLGAPDLAHFQAHMPALIWPFEVTVTTDQASL